MRQRARAAAQGRLHQQPARRARAAAAAGASGAGMSGDELRAQNLVGSGALLVADRLREAVTEAAGVEGSGPAALVALDQYAEGQGGDLLARALSITHSGAVRLVDQLVERGLLRRAPSDRDRRAVALYLTPGGPRGGARRRGGAGRRGGGGGPAPRRGAAPPPGGAPGGGGRRGADLRSR